MEHQELQTDRCMVLCKSLARASKALGINDVVLAKMLGVTVEAAACLLREACSISPESSEGKLALLLIRAHCLLEDLIGTSDGMGQAWMTCYNRAICGIPIEVMQRADGLAYIVNYLDGMQATA